ncbi:hypothetical protein CVT25_003097 [Psilocybe cyanescens]|uniref:Secreted protein n=1 Tax=Psilocybe cyanescens TaxID=93625 RepID=A0A409X5Y8_PSICY|nr:hypothetical protein CVT25_003097 [Psilocybe cyanescens]
MQLKYIIMTFAQLFAVVAIERRADPTVLTAKRVYHTVIDQSPFLVERTSTVVWTQSSSITEAQPTSAPTPTIGY